MTTIKQRTEHAMQSIVDKMVAHFDASGAEYRSIRSIEVVVEYHLYIACAEITDIYVNPRTTFNRVCKVIHDRSYPA